MAKEPGARKTGRSFLGKLIGKKQDSETSPVETNAQPENQKSNDSLEQDNSTSEKQENTQQGWFGRLKSGLARSSQNLSQSIGKVFTHKKLDQETLQDLEDILIQADLGVATATNITDRLSSEKYDKSVSDEDVRKILADEVIRVLEPVTVPLDIEAICTTTKPHVILVAGVNGAGKTTTIGKLAKNFKDQGKTVMLAAGDTFRAAAIEQLKVWSERVNAPFVSREIGADAAGLAFDALQKAREDNIDILMIDTAGRLQNKATLMEELAKIIRVIRKLEPEAPHTSLLVLDATTGQNALQQVEIFQKTAGTTGLIMTKLDGTARGGILVAIAEKYKIPVHAIGVGEQIEDLQPFNAIEFAEALTQQPK